MIGQRFVHYATPAYPYPLCCINKTEKSILYSRILKSQFDLLTGVGVIKNVEFFEAS